jgi:hypothetical protein
MHERFPKATKEWSVRAPVGSVPVPISATVRRQLQFDSALSVMWEEERLRWQLYYFRWKPGRRLMDRVRVHLAMSHRPEICVPASGAKLIREWGSIEISVAGMKLPFRVLEFAGEAGPMFVFYCVREDGRPADEAVNMRETHARRFAAAWHGDRALGQRVIELTLWGAKERGEAVGAVRRCVGGAVGRWDGASVTF